jgi:dTDP-glucose 4,6-dehydratase
VQSGAKKFLLTSSGAVYGTQPASLERTSEDFAGGPDLSHAGPAFEEGERKIASHLEKEKSRAGAIELHHLAKGMSEILCARYAHERGIETKAARIYALVGPYMPLELHFAMGNFIRDALAGEPIKIKGDGTPYRSYLYAADLTIWLWTILLRGVSNRPYNVGSRKPVSIAQLAHAVSRALPGNVAVEIAQKPVPGQLPPRYVPENMRAQQELGLREWTSLEEGIRRTAEWYMAK